MIISIDSNLKELKKYLYNKGFNVHSINENVASDIYIYSEENNSLTSLYSNISPVEEGSLILNADGKTLEEIVYSINRRLYSPLF